MVLERLNISAVVNSLEQSARLSIDKKYESDCTQQAQNLINQIAAPGDLLGLSTTFQARVVSKQHPGLVTRIQNSICNFFGIQTIAQKSLVHMRAYEEQIQQKIVNSNPGTLSLFETSFSTLAATDNKAYAELLGYVEKSKSVQLSVTKILNFLKTEGLNPEQTDALINLMRHQTPMLSFDKLAMRYKIQEDDLQEAINLNEQLKTYLAELGIANFD